MKNYHIYLFTQDNSLPCSMVASHLDSLSLAERNEVDVVPLLTAQGERTALAAELCVSFAPTLVVCHETVKCEYDSEVGYEFCELMEESVERLAGAYPICNGLDSTLDAYTYAHPE